MFSKASLHQFLSLCPAIVTYFIKGLDTGWIPPTVEWLRSNQTLIVTTSDDISWISSIGSIGSIIAVVLAAILVSKIETKYLFIFQALLLVITWCGILNTYNAVVIIICQFMEGLSSGISDVVQSIYFGEIPSSENRNLFTTLGILFRQLGENLELILSEFVPYKVYTFVPFCCSVVGFLLSFFMKESPYQLLMKNRKDGALKNLSWLNCKNEDENREEVEQLIKYIEEEKNSGSIWKLIRQPENYHPIFLGVITFVLGHCHSGLIIPVYGLIMLQPYENVINGKTFLFVYGLVHVSLWLVNPFIAKRFQPRMLLLVGFFCSSGLQFFVGCLFYVVNVLDIKCVYISYGIFVGLYAFEVFHVSAIYTAVHILQTELFPQKIKSFGISVSRILWNLMRFIVLKTFLIAWKVVGLHWIFVGFATIHLCSLIYVFIVLPNTKGKSLIEIRNIFKNKYQGYNFIESAGQGHV